MTIPVLCPGCRTTFTVSDKFAGRTGPCPKCKHSITVPAAAKEVKIHGPEEEKASRPGRVPLVPIEFVEHRVPPTAYAAVAVGGVTTALAAFLSRLAWGPGLAPGWLLATAACIVAVPCAWLGYEILRDRNLAAHHGRSLLLRSAICGAVYAALWGVRGMLPPELTADMWPWLFLAPPFLVAGGLAALAAFDFDWGTACTHYGFYVLCTATLRWLAGFMPI